ncbi:MAG: LamG domain-containing protein, partial [Candidatus Omnitrophica bacterium]|nr:LamG domain-containing protein [Candidatus Omnitrophota bacterium]
CRWQRRTALINTNFGVNLRSLQRNSASTNQKGMVLTMVLYIIIVFVIIGLVLITLMIVNNQSSYQLLYSTQAYYLAEAGVEYGLMQLSSDPMWLVDSDALSFDGTDDYVMVPRYGNYYFGTGAFSIEAWFNANTVSSYRPVVCSGNPNSEPAVNFWVQNSKIRFILRESGGLSLVDLYSNLTLSTGAWYHCVVVRDGANMKIYIGGNLDNSRTNGPTGNVGSSTYQVYIGKMSYASYWFNGLIDEVRIYNRALTQEEIQYSYNYKMPLNRTGLVGWWKFASGYTSIDSSGKGNNGTVYGATSTTGVYKPSPVGLAAGTGFNPLGQSNCSFSVSFIATAVQNGLLTSVSSVEAKQVISLDKAPAQRVVSVNVPRIY